MAYSIFFLFFTVILLQILTGLLENETIPVALRLYVKRLDRSSRPNPDGSSYIEFNANLTSVSYSSTVGELVAVEAAFEATGRIRTSYL